LIAGVIVVAIVIIAVVIAIIIVMCTCKSLAYAQNLKIFPYAWSY
jgi:hypothetical protein